MEKPDNISQNDWFLLCKSRHISPYYINKINKGYPIQYLIGYVDFYGVKINVNKHTLIPRFETEYLVSKTIEFIDQYFDNNIKIVDAGTGSGCIAIRLKKEYPNATINAFDKSFNALRLAKKNALENNTKINFIRNSFNNYNDSQVDVLISNPPYIDKNGWINDNVKKYEPNIALFAKENGIKYYDEILHNSIEYMNYKSLICFEIGYDQADMIKKIIIKYYPSSKISVLKDLQGKDRYIIIFNNIIT